MLLRYSLPLIVQDISFLVCSSPLGMAQCTGIQGNCSYCCWRQRFPNPVLGAALGFSLSSWSLLESLSLKCRVSYSWYCSAGFWCMCVLWPDRVNGNLHPIVQLAETVHLILALQSSAVAVSNQYSIVNPDSFIRVIFWSFWPRITQEGRSQTVGGKGSNRNHQRAAETEWGIRCTLLWSSLNDLTWGLEPKTGERKCFLTCLHFRKPRDTESVPFFLLEQSAL